MLLMYILGGIFWGMFWGVIGYKVGEKTEHEDAGFWLGFFLGPIGCFVAFMLYERDDRIYYSQMRRNIPEMVICPYCGARFYGRGIVQCCKCNEQFDSGR